VNERCIDVHVDRHVIINTSEHPNYESVQERAVQEDNISIRISTAGTWAWASA